MTKTLQEKIKFIRDICVMCNGIITYDDRPIYLSDVVLALKLGVKGKSINRGMRETTILQFVWDWNPTEEKLENQREEYIDNLFHVLVLNY